MTATATWLLILFGIGIGLLAGVPAAYVLLGLATSSSTEDMARELWHVKRHLARLVIAVEGDTRTIGNDAINEALEEARRVLL